MEHEAGSPQAVHDAAARAGLRLARVTEALCEPREAAGDIPADGPSTKQPMEGTTLTKPGTHPTTKLGS